MSKPDARGLAEAVRIEVGPTDGHVFIMGVVSAGKTTLYEELVPMFPDHVIAPEPILGLLDAFLADQARYAERFQREMMVTRVCQMLPPACAAHMSALLMDPAATDELSDAQMRGLFDLLTRGRSLFGERCVIDDWVFVRLQQEAGHISDGFLRWYGAVRALAIEVVRERTTVVFVRARWETCHARMLARGREGYAPAYMKRMAELYEELLVELRQLGVRVIEADNEAPC